jgi:hypothetical protein
MKTKLLGRIVARSVSLGFVVGVAITIGVIVAGPARAATLVGTTSAATGIDGLVVHGVTYDVTFVYDTYNDVYASTSPTFLGNESGASDAATALATELNTLGVVGLAGLSAPYDGYLNINVPFSFTIMSGSDFNSGIDAGCGSLTGGTCVTSWITLSDDNQHSDMLIYNDEYSVFTATPLPAAFPLFASVLGVGGLLSWRRKRKSAAGAIAVA